MIKIKYKSGYKYQLMEDYKIQTLHIGTVVEGDWYDISDTGMLYARKRYAWDGPTGGFDTENFMRASLVHDVFCQAIQEGKLPQSSRKYADKLLRKICLEDGMSRFRAYLVYKAVRTYVKAAY